MVKNKTKEILFYVDEVNTLYLHKNVILTVKDPNAFFIWAWIVSMSVKCPKIYDQNLIDHFSFSKKRVKKHLLVLIEYGLIEDIEWKKGKEPHLINLIRESDKF